MLWSLRTLARAGSLALGCLAFGCTDEKLPAGQLMLAFDSDMAIPKDVSVVELRGAVGQEGTFVNFEVGPAPANRLPATFGIRSEDGSSKVVEITLNAGKDLRTRTISVVEASIPTDRVALLRMPIQWLCTLRVTEDSEGNFLSDCDADETCNAGRCEPAAVEESELPTYHPDDVFGTGGIGDGDSGTCFDTTTCFVGRAGQVVTDEIDPATCRIPIASGTTNFGLRVRGGDGVCVTSDLCLVTLNRSERTGWFEVDADGNAASGGGFAQLPEIICEELAPTTGAVIDVYRADCEPVKVPALPLCGPWSSAGPADEDDPSVQCPEVGSGKPGEDIVEDPVVATVIDLSNELGVEVAELLAQLGEACVAIAEPLGVEDSWSSLGYDVERPTEASVRAACLSATGGLVSALTDVQRVKADFAPGHCVIDTAPQLACEEQCSPESECEEADRCPEESVVAACRGECDVGSVCQGAVDNLTSCNGLCTGTCKGTCEGVCTRIGESAPCEGICEGLCAGQCAGSCELEIPEICGTGTTCRGPCDLPQGEQSCAVPLSSCEGVEARCGALCATRAALQPSCEFGGTLVARTDLDPVDADLEQVLEEQAVPNLSLVEDVRLRATLIANEQAAIDFDTIVSSAADVGTQEGACAEVARGMIRTVGLRVVTLATIAERLLQAVRAVPVRRPVACSLLLAGDACEQCIGDNCCRESAACLDDERCLTLSGGGEVACVIRCLAGSGVINDATKQACTQQCLSDGETTLLAVSQDLLACINSNTSGSCELDCYAAESDPP